MQKIGILTTHRANNFGAVLQAYSLVMACRELGVDANIIDWRCPHYEWQYHSAIRVSKNPIAMGWHFLWYCFKERSSRILFDGFRKQLPLSVPVKNKGDLKDLVRLYDSIIVGSDQVWNPLNSAIKAERFDRTYLLDFAQNCKRNAYAASIGVCSIEPASILPEFIEAWKCFDVITMREHAGAEYVSQYLNCSIDTVLDPVLLHDREWWSKVINTSSLPDKFVFEYNVRGVEALEDFAKEKARQCSAKLIRPLIPSFSFVRQRDLMPMGPAEFVAAIANAACVVTSSFHAAAFSVLFGKKLYLIQRRNSGDPNSRFSSLLRFADLQSQIIVSNDHYEILSIDCKKADLGGLRRERDRSLTRLRKMCDM